MNFENACFTGGFYVIQVYLGNNCVFHEHYIKAEAFEFERRDGYYVPMVQYQNMYAENNA